jgi:hypothetical protein
MIKKESLDVGGSIGSIKGNFYEKHFGKVLTSLGYKIRPFKEFEKHKNDDKTAFHKYRTSPDQFTEIDFFIPTKRIGFWVTNLGQVERYRAEETSKDFNEFTELKGSCPHCKEKNLPNKKEEDVLNKWTCSKCNRIVSPFDLENKQSILGESIIKYENKSASMQAHKQAYYRIGEYIESRTSNDRVACIEIIYNERSAWRNWSHVVELFFDETIFIFDDIGKTIGSDTFETKLTKKIKCLIDKPPTPNPLILEVLKKAEQIRSNKLNQYQNWLQNIRSSRINLWKSDMPVSFPVRYSLYGLLKGKKRFIDKDRVYIYSVLIKIKSAKLKLNTLSAKEKKQLKIIKNKYADQDFRNLTKAGEQFLTDCINQYDKVICEIKDNTLTFEQDNDFWFPENKDIIIKILSSLKQSSIKNYWYKFIMISSYDYRELNNTPFINEQFEPLETLTYLRLWEFKQKGIIKDVFGEPGIDNYEKTWLCDMPFAKNDSGFMLGTDVEIELKNGKKVYIQCKSNTSFKNWELNPGLIKNSGITYKDSKRMIAHNFFSLFNFKNQELKFNESRIYIAIIDGNWCATKKDIYRTLKLMYLLGVDEIFFADEFDTRLKEFLIKKGK